MENIHRPCHSGWEGLGKCHQVNMWSISAMRADLSNVFVRKVAPQTPTLITIGHKGQMRALYE